MSIPASPTLDLAGSARLTSGLRSPPAASSSAALTWPEEAPSVLRQEPGGLGRSRARSGARPPSRAPAESPAGGPHPAHPPGLCMHVAMATRRGAERVRGVACAEAPWSEGGCSGSTICHSASRRPRPATLGGSVGKRGLRGHRSGPRFYSKKGADRPKNPSCHPLL